MYKIYDTKGFIVGKRDLGSDDLSYYIFTEEFGFITAKAYSVRLEKSKMSKFLQSLNLCNLSLTKGKGGWVITGGGLLHSIYYGNSPDSAVLYKKIFNLISKLSVREESQKETFKIIESSLDFMKGKNSDYLTEIELFLNIKVLSDFGYINMNQISLKTDDLFNKGLSFQLLDKIKENKVFLVKKLNESLSHLDI